MTGPGTSNKAALTLTTGLEDAEKVTVALLTAVAAAESGRPTLVFLAKEAVRLALRGHAQGVACEGCPPLAGLMERYAAAGGQFIACGVCFSAKQLEKDQLVDNAQVAGTVQLWEWIGEGATTFSF
jgi:predicted peroxiredoxin